MVLLVIFTVLLLFIIVLFIRNKIFDSQHKKQKKVIQKAANLYETILKIMPIGMAVFKGNPPRVIDCNDELTIMFDASKQHIIDHYFEDFSPRHLPDGQLTAEVSQRIMKRAMAGETVRVEWPHQTADGVFVPCDLILTRVKDDDEFVGLGFLYDLRKIKRLNKRLENAYELVSEASEAKGLFLSNMSHEIRTPLNAIIGMTVIGKSADNTSRKDYCFEKIGNASHHMLGVINDVLDMSKIEAKNFELSNVEFDFEKMLKRVVGIISFRADEKKQDLSVHIDPSMPKIIICDDQRLAQVITNLLGNAVKYTPEGGAIKLDTRFISEENGVYTIQISVIDTGIGISLDRQEKLFSSYTQTNYGKSQEGGSSGLGLIISKNIAELMGGYIDLRSELGKGSTFSFIFKARRGVADDKAGANKQQDDFADYHEIFKGYKVLLAEDVDINREIVETLLEPTLLEVDFAENGVEAVSMFEKAPNAYNLILMDVQMPEMDGYEATRRIRLIDNDVSSKIPIIAMTANVFREEIDKCLAAGMNDHIGKPLDIVEFFTKLRKYLN